MQTKMQMVWMFVTVEFAAGALAKNQRNRKWREAATKRILSDIARDEYLPTHQAIAFYEDGVLADGQHRLEAIARGKKGIWSWVCFGVPVNSALVIDGGVARTDHDSLAIMGRDYTRNMVDIAKALYEFCGSRPHRKMTKPELDGYIRRHEKAIRFACDAGGCGRKSVTQAAIKAVIARAYYTADQDRLREFGVSLVNGEYGPGDEAVLALRNFVLLNVSGRGAGNDRAVVYWKTESALTAYLAHRPLSKLYAAEVEQFPLPEETDPDVPAAEQALAISA